MKLAGDELEAGHGAVFVMAEDAKADEIATKIRRLSNLKQYDGQILRAQCVRASNRLGFGAALMTALGARDPVHGLRPRGASRHLHKGQLPLRRRRPQTDLPRNL